MISEYIFENATNVYKCTNDRYYLVQTPYEMWQLDRHEWCMRPTPFEVREAMFLGKPVGLHCAGSPVEKLSKQDIERLMRKPPNVHLTGAEESKQIKKLKRSCHAHLKRLDSDGILVECPPADNLLFSYENKSSKLGFLDERIYIFDSDDNELYPYRASEIDVIVDVINRKDLAFITGRDMCWLSKAPTGLPANAKVNTKYDWSVVFGGVK